MQNPPPHAPILPNQRGLYTCTKFFFFGKKFQGTMGIIEENNDLRKKEGGGDGGRRVLED